MQRWQTRVSGVFVPAVIAIALATILVWLITGQTVGFALAKGISVLVISCPCALGLATPVAIMVGNGIGCKERYYVQGQRCPWRKPERPRSLPWIRTGTITSGEPKVTDILPADGVTEAELLAHAYALEKKSEHPLARAVIVRAEAEKVDGSLETDDFHAVVRVTG